MAQGGGEQSKVPRGHIAQAPEEEEDDGDIDGHGDDEDLALEGG